MDTEERNEPMQEDIPAEETAETAAQDEKKSKKKNKKPNEADTLKEELAKQKEQYLFLAAEYDNFRKRSQKEKDSIYQDAKADAVKKLLPVFDNLERALNQETTDEAYKKGVEMTMQGLREAFKSLGVEEFGEAGDTFDPNMHNAVMHIENEELGENVIAQVFAKGFKVGDRVIRFAMVQVAN